MDTGDAIIPAMPFNREELKQQVAGLAIQGVYIGASSWKYPGWRGTLYDRMA